MSGYSIEQMVIGVLAQAVRDGIVTFASENFDELDPVNSVEDLRSGHVVGPANVLSDYLKGEEPMPDVSEDTIRKLECAAKEVDSRIERLERARFVSQETMRLEFSCRQKAKQ